MYNKQHEVMTADEIMAHFGGNAGMRYIRLRRLDNRTLRRLSKAPARCNFDIVHAGDEEDCEYLEAVIEADAARAVHAARSGKDLNEITRPMSFEKREAYLYRT